MSTMKRIAEQAGVSQATVSRVISGHASVSADKRRAVMAAARRLSYVRNSAAAGLATRRSGLLGLIVPELTNPFFGEIVHQVGMEAVRHGYSLVLGLSGGDAAREPKVLDSLREQQVEGVMIAGSNPASKVFRKLQAIRLPTVLFTQEHEGFDSVAVAHDKGGELVARHLLDLGYEHCAWVGVPDDQKFDGFQHVLHSRGLEVPRENQLYVGFFEEEMAHKAYEISLKFFKRRKRAANCVFTTNDIAAFGVLRALQELNIRVPEDVAIVGFDNTFISRETRPSLTTVAQPIAEIGRTTFELLLSRIQQEPPKEPARLRLQPRLIVRQSTRGFDV